MVTVLRWVSAAVLIPLLALAPGAEEGGGFGDFDKTKKQPAKIDDGKTDAGKGDAAKKAADGQDDAKAKKKGKEDPWAGKTSPVPPTGGTAEADQWVASRTTTIAGIREFCRGRGLAIAEHNGQAVQLLVVGNANVDAKMVVDNADLALKGLETWTGEPQAFSRKGMPADEIYHLVIFPDTPTRHAYIDATTPDDKKELSKQAGGSSFARGAFTDAAIIPIQRWWGVFAGARAAIDAFYFERGQKPQVWLREGLACELQRLVCDKQVKCYSIAYQNNAGVKLDGDWSKDMAKMLGSKNAQLLPASGVMLTDVVGIMGEHYRQMWSLTTYLKGVARNQKGPENKLLRVFCDTAKGVPARDAVKAAYDSEDPALTKAWYAWAAQGK